MARAARMFCDGGIYHILNRGHNKQLLFRDAMDYSVFKRILKRYLSIFTINIYNYVLMPNHFHFLLKVSLAKDLPRFMKCICQTYAKYHHAKYDFVGYLFQNRYKSMHIQNDRYLLECARYIERNPIRAGMVHHLTNHPHSSYHFYAQGYRDSLVTLNPLYPEIGISTPKRKKAYIEYLHGPRPYEEILDKKLQISR